MKKLLSISKVSQINQTYFYLTIQFIYSYLFITNIFTKCLYRCAELLPIEAIRTKFEIYSLFIILYISMLDKIQVVSHIIVLFYYLCILHIYYTYLFLSPTQFEKINSVRIHNCEFRRMPNAFPSNKLNHLPRLYQFNRHFFKS